LSAVKFQSIQYFPKSHFSVVQYIPVIMNANKH